MNYNTSLNRTEIGHLGATAYLYETFQFDVFHVNPPLTRTIVGLPIVLADPKYDWDAYSSNPQHRPEWNLGRALVRSNSFEKIRRIVFFSRSLLVPLILLGSYFGYRFASELYGQISGLVFLILWTFSPFVLGWGATICPDVAAASFGIVGLYTFRCWLIEPTWTRVAIAGVCLGLLPLTKLTWVIAFPIWLIIWGVWRLHRRLSRISSVAKQPIASFAQMASIFLLAIYLINVGYCFDGSLKLLKKYQFASQTLTGIEREPDSHTVPIGNRFADSWIGYLPVPLPAEFIQGIDTQKVDFERGMESYLLGQYSERGWWYYYAYAFLIKEPLGTLCLLVIAIFASCLSAKYRASWPDEITILLPPIVLFAFVSSQTGFSLHARYVIPALPFIYIWTSKLGLAFQWKRRLLSIVIVLLLVWTVGSSLYYFPHSMSYFNELIGGPKNGPKHLLGSNVDWGQNSYLLKKWYDEHPEARPIAISYESTSYLDWLGINESESPPDYPESGWYAIEVNQLYDSTGQFEYLKKLEPADRIGYGIYIYNITPEKSRLIKAEADRQDIN